MTNPPMCGFAFRTHTCDQPGKHSSPDHTCGYQVCSKAGDHFCQPRASRFYLFCGEMLCHVKGAMVGKPLWLDEWQVREVAEPVFGKVRWSDHFQRYVRQYTVVWIETARKTGKSHLLAAILLYLLVAEGESAAELYGAARNKEQARVVYNVAKLMVQNSTKLSRKLRVVDYLKRIVNPALASVFVCISADDDAALGQDPQALICDEIVAWRSRALWDATRSGMGSAARAQPLMIAATTPGTNLASFAKHMHDSMVRIAKNPESSPHTYVLLRNAPRSESELQELHDMYPGHPDLPVSTDVFDEQNWKWPQPGIGVSVTVDSMREQAQEAAEDPASENAFRVFKMAQWTAQLFRWMPMSEWDTSAGPLWTHANDARQLNGRPCYAGLDLSAKSDLTAWCLLFPRDDDAFDAVWRFWVSGEAFEYLDHHHNGDFTRWAQQGWIQVHDGVTIDYEQVYADLIADSQRYRLQGMDADEWTLLPVIQRIGNDIGLGPKQVHYYRNTYDKMSVGMESVKTLVKQQRMLHHGNPVARFCFENVEVRRAPYNTDLIRPEKPVRQTGLTRIDAVPTLAMAENCRQRMASGKRSAYEDQGLFIV